MLIGDLIDELLDDRCARLCQIKDNQVFARSSGGKPLPWEQYPMDMCYWRAIARLCRFLFSDIGVGVYHTEEFSVVDDSGVLMREDIGAIDQGPTEPTPLSDEAYTKFKEACAQHNIEASAVLKRAFPDGLPDLLTDDHLPLMRDTFKAMIAEHAAAHQDIETKTAAPDNDPQWVSAETGEAPAPRDDGSMRPATRKQIAAIKIEYTRLEMPDRKEQLATTKDIIGHAVTSHTKLTTDEASRLIDALKNVETPAPPAEDDIIDAEIVE